MLEGIQVKFNMREIKFRAYVPKLKKMGKVSEINWMTKTILVATNRVVNNIYRLTQVKLMQFTGLKDISGFEIYEGDIVSYVDGEFSFIAQVVIDNYQFWLTGPYDNYSFEDFADENTGKASDLKVIGNKFENPELLEVN